MQMRVSLLVLGCLLSLPTTPFAQLLRAAPEFQVNAYSTGTQTIPAIARPGIDGGFVVVWSSYHDGDLDGVFGRRFDADGVPLGGEFQVNQHTTGQQNRPRIAASTAGNFVVVWSSSSTTQDGSGAGIFGRLFDSAGAPVGNEFQLNEYTTGNQMTPAVTMDYFGQFLVVWSSEGQDGDDLGVFGRRFDAAGTPLGGEFQANTYTTSDQFLPGVARDVDGKFMVAWTSDGQDGDGRGMFARSYDGSGTPVGPEFQVNEYTTGAQYGALGASITPSLPGSFAIAWGSAGEDASGYAAIGRRFDETGAPLGSEFQINSYTTGDQYPLAITTGVNGSFIVTWASVGQDGSGLGSFVKPFTVPPGNPFAPEFQVNEFTTGSQFATGVMTDNVGNIVLASISDGQDGDGRGIFAQHFAIPRYIRGKRLTVKDPTGSESARTAIIFATERPTDAFGGGDPVVGGATLRIIVDGTTPSDETYALDAEGWTTVPNGFTYSGPTGLDGDPVRRATIKFTPTGTVAVKVILKGSVGTQPLNVVPPNTGSGKSGFILKFNGGGSAFCTAFGVGPGGYILADTATTYRLARPGGEDCP